MSENVLLPTLEKHVDTDFSVGDLQPSTTTGEQQESSFGVTSSSVTSGGGDDDNDDQNQQPLDVPKIVAAGRGTALYMPAIFSKVLELSGRDTPNVLYIGTASFDKDVNYNRHSKEFLQRGCLVKRLLVSEPDTVPPLEEMHQLVVEWAHVIVCSGGNTLHALLRWKETGLDLLIKQAAQQGTVLCGGSAGAGCWFSSMHSDSLRPDNVKHADIVKEELDEEELADWDYVKISGLGIISTQAMAVPHFDATGTNDVSRSEHAEQVLVEEQDGVPAIGIDNNAALVVEGDKAQVVSGDGQATCHVVVVAQEETEETLSAPLVPTEELVPLDELVDLVNPATAEHLETLEEHVDTDFAITDDGLQFKKQVPKIVAAGCMKALQMPPVFEKIVELSGKEKPKICYIGTASFDRTDKYNICTKAFRELDCEIERLDVSEEDTVPSPEEMRRLVVDWADVLLCSGGNTLHALLRWKDTGLDLLLKEAAEQGSVLCGGSAGAGCWFSSIHSDSLRPDNVKNAECVKNELDNEELTDWDYVKINGLGIIPAMAVPHFDATGTNDVSRSEHAEQVLIEEQEGKLAIGIDENAALVVVGDKAMVVSGDGEATCHVMIADGETEETSIAPLVPIKELVPLTDWMALAGTKK